MQGEMEAKDGSQEGRYKERDLEGTLGLEPKTQFGYFLSLLSTYCVPYRFPSNRTGKGTHIGLLVEVGMAEVCWVCRVVVV